MSVGYERRVGGMAYAKWIVGLVISTSLVCGAQAGVAAAQPATAGGPLTWSDPAPVDTNEIQGIACAAASRCTALDDQGALVSSSSVGGSANGWQRTALKPIEATSAVGVGCDGDSLCIAEDSPAECIGCFSPEDENLAFVRGLFGPGAPTSEQVGWNSVAAGKKCFPGRLCVRLIDDFAYESTTHDVRGRITARTLIAPDQALACPSGEFCISGLGSLSISTTPGRRALWPILQNAAMPGAFMTAVACPSVSLCVASDDDGYVYTSTDPTSGPSWTSGRLPGTGTITSLACPSVSLCEAVYNGQLLTSTDPAAGPSAWAPQTIDPDAPLTAVTCPTSSRCVAGDENGDILVGSGSAPAAVAPLGVATSSLRHALASLCRGLSARRIERGGCTAALTAPLPGTAAIALTDQRGATLARGSARLAAGQRGRVGVRLTAAGARLLRHGRAGQTVHVDGYASFTDTIGELRSTQLKLALA
jgi:hypothetical protein